VCVLSAPAVSAACFREEVNGGGCLCDTSLRTEDDACGCYVAVGCATRWIAAVVQLNLLCMHAHTCRCCLLLVAGCEMCVGLLSIVAVWQLQGLLCLLIVAC
jgi:hypothetical protein